MLRLQQDVWGGGGGHVDEPVLGVEHAAFQLPVQLGGVDLQSDRGRRGKPVGNDLLNKMNEKKNRPFVAGEAYLACSADTFTE